MLHIPPQFTSFSVVQGKTGVKKRLPKAEKNKVTIAPSSVTNTTGKQKKKGREEKIFLKKSLNTGRKT